MFLARAIAGLIAISRAPEPITFSAPGRYMAADRARLALRAARLRAHERRDHVQGAGDRLRIAAAEAKRQRKGERLLRNAAAGGWVCAQ